MGLQRNIIANYIGQGWSGLIGIAFVPLYIKYLGIEAYGLIGVFALLQAWLTLLDMGMTPTLNREMARFTSGIHTLQSIRDLLHCLEIICFTIALLISVLIWGASEWLATNWLHADKLSSEDTAQSIIIMGIVVALRFSEGIYRGAILGLQKQVFFNIVNTSFATLRAVGAIAILIWVSPTIKAYFFWQGFVSIISVIIFASATHKNLPVAATPPKFSWQALAEVRSFAGGMVAGSFLALLMTQVDKILLSQLLSLEAFGYYTLASSVAAALALLITPLTQAFYPRFTELVAHGDTQELVRTYHLGSQLLTVLTAPYALMMIFFGQQLLELWTGDTAIALNAAPLLAILSLGMLLNGLVLIPYTLQLAYGWPGFTVRAHCLAVAILLPALLYAIPHYGATGAAWAWVFLNAGYVLISAHFMHKRLLVLEKWKWYGNDVLCPIVASTVIAVFFRFTQPISLGKIAELSWLLFGGLLMVCAAALAAPELRALFFCHFTKK